MSTRSASEAGVLCLLSYAQSRRPGSNRAPPTYEVGALPDELRRQRFPGEGRCAPLPRVRASGRRPSALCNAGPFSRTREPTSRRPESNRPAPDYKSGAPPREPRRRTCPRRELNPHARRHRPLKTARLPVFATWTLAREPGRYTGASSEVPSSEACATLTPPSRSLARTRTQPSRSRVGRHTA